MRGHQLTDSLLRSLPSRGSNESTIEGTGDDGETDGSCRACGAAALDENDDCVGENSGNQKMTERHEPEWGRGEKERIAARGRVV